MEQRFSLTLTPDEIRSLLMVRVERCLAESGVTLPVETRELIARALPVPDDTRTELPARVATPARSAAVEPRTAREGDQRARAYRPTTKAKPVAHPTSTAEKVLNLILKADNAVCTLPDLERGVNKPRKSIYTALWTLKRDKLIETIPLAAAQK